MPDILPGYSYSRSLQRYRSDETGRFVSRDAINDLLDAQTTSLENRLGALVQAVHDGNLAPSYAAEQMRTEMRRGHLQARALGAGGWDRLTQSDYGAVGQKLRQDYGRMTNLLQGIQDGTVSLPQALNRVNGYAGNARREMLEAQRQRAQAGDGNSLIIELRTLGNAEHCGDCVNYHQQGWQPAGVLPLPGDNSQCTTHCRCRMTSREVAVADSGEWIGTRRAS